MTFRRDLACTAMAALALIISDVAAHAAMRSCNAEPWRCRYGPDGRGYFYAYPHAPPSTVTGPASSGHVVGAWGCGATDGKATGRSWGHANQASASYRALAACAERSVRGGCHVVSCSPSVHNYTEAHVAWFSNR